MALNVVLQNDNPLAVSNKAIVFYDGDCGLCHHSVRWIVKQDKKNLFHYQNLNSLTKPFAHRDRPIDSIVFYEEGKYYIKSSAVIQILRKLGKIKTAFFLTLFPRLFRDFIYTLFAKSRKFFFPPPTVCTIDYNKK